MPSSRELRRRIKSIRSTRQITKAMELVSSAKMRRASEATLASRPYVERAERVVADVTENLGNLPPHPLLAARPIKNVFVFAISSDRGLAGPYTTNLTKRLLSLVKEGTAQEHVLTFFTMGRQLERVLVKLGQAPAQSYPHTSSHPTSATTLPLAETLSQAYLNQECDEVLVLYTHFHSLLVQEVRCVRLLPLGETPPVESEFPEEPPETKFRYEPTPALVLETVLPRLLEARLYQFLQESLSSEHAARRLAMKSASDNASDMIDDLNLTYNGIRQSTITRELAEITSGADALTKTTS